MLERVNIQVTRRCNLTCRHCYADCPSAVASCSEMSLQEIANLVAQIAELGVAQVTISGGEPLLRMDLFEILDFCMSFNSSLMLATNGILISSEIANRLRSTGVDYVSVGVDGLHSTTHDWMRGHAGAYDLTIRGIEHLRTAGIARIRVVSCVNSRNYVEIPGLLAMLDSLGVSEWWPVFFLPVGRGVKEENLQLTPDQVKWVEAEVENMQRRHSGHIVINKDSCRFPFEKPCSAGVSWCAVTAEGYVVPCTFLSAPDFTTRLQSSNIRSESLETIWHNYEIFLKLRKYSQHVGGRCKTCHRLTTCGGGCRVLALSKADSLFSSDPRCNRTHD